MALDGPIFIVGAPRSGTSFLRVTLNRHPAIELCDETAFFYKVWVRRQAFGDLAILENRQRFISQYIETSNVKALGVDRELLAQRLMRDGTNYQAFFTTPLILPSLAPENPTRQGSSLRSSCARS